LRTLRGFPAHMDCDHCSLEELGPLSQLTDLNIGFLENVAWFHPGNIGRPEPTYVDQMHIASRFLFHQV
jgi:hypothetical protein